jgi:hypothetical protein
MVQAHCGKDSTYGSRGLLSADASRSFPRARLTSRTGNTKRRRSVDPGALSTSPRPSLSQRQKAEVSTASRPQRSRMKPKQGLHVHE